MDLNKIMELANNPQVRQLLQSLFQQFQGKGGGGAANLNGLVDQLNGGGLQQQVQSWLGTGQNQPVTGEQLSKALGPQLEQAAAQAGETPQKAADQLADVLPQLVNQASPDGQLPDAQALQDMFGRMFEQPGGTP
jgi:uncharacterized protein YidB (DUF937 family)